MACREHSKVMASRNSCRVRSLLLTQQGAHLAPVLGHDPGLAPREVMAGSNGGSVTALLKQFFDHTQRNGGAPGHLLTSAFPLIVSRQNPLP